MGLHNEETVGRGTQWVMQDAEDIQARARLDVFLGSATYRLYFMRMVAAITRDISFASNLPPLTAANVRAG